eukprot:m.248951 g.248951  ORF g.248951 m.248951 type:complete len:97 (+) comp54492_c0_seq16:177-467(+)
MSPAPITTCVACALSSSGCVSTLIFAQSFEICRPSEPFDDSNEVSALIKMGLRYNSSLAKPTLDPSVIIRISDKETLLVAKQAEITFKPGRAFRVG